MSTKTQRIIGWVLTVLVGLFLIGASGVPKFVDFPGKADLMTKLQIPMNLLTTLGIIEVSVAVLYLIPRTAFLGAILATAHLGGAVWTHLRVGEPWFFPIIIGVLMWSGLALRHPMIFRLLLGQESLAPTINDPARR
jgi:protein-S-isoprenylcysteine O-methyltransferase Ste14